MLYQEEFAKIKAVYDTLPEPAQEAARLISYLPIGAVAVFGLVLLPLGIIGIGGLLLIAIASCAASAAMIFACVPFEEETGVPALRRRATAFILRRKTEVTLDGEAQDFTATALQLPANDAPTPPPQAMQVSLQKAAQG